MLSSNGSVALIEYKHGAIQTEVYRTVEEMVLSLMWGCNLDLVEKKVAEIRAVVAEEEEQERKIEADELDRDGNPHDWDAAWAYFNGEEMKDAFEFCEDGEREAIAKRYEDGERTNDLYGILWGAE